VGRRVHEEMFGGRSRMKMENAGFELAVRFNKLNTSMHSMSSVVESCLR